MHTMNTGGGGGEEGGGNGRHNSYHIRTYTDLGCNSLLDLGFASVSYLLQLTSSYLGDNYYNNAYTYYIYIYIYIYKYMYI